MPRIPNKPVSFIIMSIISPRLLHLNPYMTFRFSYHAQAHLLRLSSFPFSSIFAQIDSNLIYTPPPIFEIEIQTQRRRIEVRLHLRIVHDFETVSDKERADSAAPVGREGSEYMENFFSAARHAPDNKMNK